MELKMPALSPTMEIGTLAKWLVAEGDRITSGDVLAEIETDKATMELEAVDDGRIVQFLIAAGTDDVAVGTVIALLDQAEGLATPSPLDIFKVTPVAEDHHQPVELSPESLNQVALAQPAPMAQPVSLAGTKSARARASPLASRLATAQEISLSNVAGSGPDGLVVRADLMPIRTPDGDTPLETVGDPSSERYHLSAHCRVGALLSLRDDLNLALCDRSIRLSTTDMLIKAITTALGMVPNALAQLAAQYVQQQQWNLQMTIGTITDGRLSYCVVEGVEKLAMSAIARIRGAGNWTRADGRNAQLSDVLLIDLGETGVHGTYPTVRDGSKLNFAVSMSPRSEPTDNNRSAEQILSATVSFDESAIDVASGVAIMSAFRERIKTPIGLLG